MSQQYFSRSLHTFSVVTIIVNYCEECNISGSSHSGGATVISNIRPGSVAHRCGTLSPGDRILSVNNHSLSEYSQEQAVEILHSAHDIVTLVVQKMDQGKKNVYK